MTDDPDRSLFTQFSVVVRWLEVPDGADLTPLSLTLTCDVCGDSHGLVSNRIPDATSWLIEHGRRHVRQERRCVSPDSCRAGPRVAGYHVGLCTFDCRKPECKLPTPHAGPCQHDGGTR